MFNLLIIIKKQYSNIYTTINIYTALILTNFKIKINLLSFYI